MVIKCETPGGDNFRAIKTCLNVSLDCRGMTVDIHVTKMDRLRLNAEKSVKHGNIGRSHC